MRRSIFLLVVSLLLLQGLFTYAAETTTEPAPVTGGEVVKTDEPVVGGDEPKPVTDDEEAKKKAEEEAAAKKKKAEEEEAAAKKKAEEEAAAAKKKAEEEEAAAKKKAEEEAAAAKKKAEEEEAAAKKKAEEEAAAAKKKAEEEEAAAKKKAEEEEAAKKKKAEEEEAKKKAEEEAKKKADEEAKKKKEEEAAKKQEEEDKKTVVNTTNALAVGTTLKGRLNGTQTVAFEFTHNDTKVTNYTIYLPKFSKDKFTFTLLHKNASAPNATAVEGAHELYDDKSGLGMIQEFEAKEGVYTLNITNKPETTDVNHTYTLVVTPFASLKAEETVRDNTEKSIIKSYLLKAEKDGKVDVITTECYSNIAVLIPVDQKEPILGEASENSFTIATSFEVKKDATYRIHLIERQDAKEAADFSFIATQAEKKEAPKPLTAFKPTQKLLNYTNTTDEITFEFAEYTDAKNTKPFTDFTATYTLIAAVNDKELARTRRCGLRVNETHSTVQTLNLASCTNNNVTNATNCTVKVEKFKLHTENITIGLEGKIVETKTNDTQIISFGNIESTHLATPLPIEGGQGGNGGKTPAAGAANKWWLWTLIALVVVGLVLGALFWRRSKAINDKLEESANYKAIEA